MEPAIQILLIIEQRGESLLVAHWQRPEPRKKHTPLREEEDANASSVRAHPQQARTSITRYLHSNDYLITRYNTIWGRQRRVGLNDEANKFLDTCRSCTKAQAQRVILYQIKN
jgi:hypothetical protein